MRITFISASAGSGKTYRITEIIEDRLARGICRPGGLIATTFTVKAAHELRERLQRRLYDQGNIVLAERLEEGLIGTVHSVCGQLLGRFAFEAGISPRLEIISEEPAAALLSQAVEAVADFATLQRLQNIAIFLGQQDSKTKGFSWKADVQALVDAAQANNIAPEAFSRMAEQSAQELTGFLPPAVGTDLDAALGAAIKTAIKRIRASDDDSSGTREYLQVLQDSQRDLESGRLAWSAWVKLSKEQPTQPSQAHASPVIAIAAQFERHPRLREHIREYTTTLFSLAQRALTEFRRLKEERGLLDFADLEQRALHLLQDNPSVKEALRQELDLLAVDEFQDTSPIQLAIFMELASCARETVWVGDVKQAIYGFRNGDPALINAVIAEVEKSGGLADPLDNSYRSTPELVRLTNALFTPAFAASLRLPEKQVRLVATRDSIRPAQPAVEFLELSSGQMTKTDPKLKRLTNEQFAKTLAERVAGWLNASPRLRIMDRGQLRPLELRDIAILCRTNADAAQMAGALSLRGLPVSLAESGLLATPEGRLAIACLRRLVDPADTLATAEIIALQSSVKPEAWLEQRLEYLAQRAVTHDAVRVDRWGVDEPFAHPAVQALEQARPSLVSLSVRESLDLALDTANVFVTVSSWGPNLSRAAQRRANLESLRALAQKYEEACVTSHLPATVAGFLFWCDDLAASCGDVKGSDDQLDAIHVSTYHKAKGLEWPVVVCAGFDDDPKTRLWGLTVAAQDPSQPFDLRQPLSNRRLRSWVWPFGAHETGIPLVSRVDADPVGRKAARVAQQEELRLLYVGFTRARDLLVVARDIARESPWLDLLEAPWFHAKASRLRLPDGSEMPAIKVTLRPPQQVAAPPPDPSYGWFPPAVARTAKEPARLVPSQQPAIDTFSIGQIIDLGARLPLTGNPEEAALGDALHAILAAELAHPSHPDRRTTADRILREYGLDSFIRVDDVIVKVDRFLTHLRNEFSPKSILVETPFEYANEKGQRLQGFIDLLLETDCGWVIIDHKSFMGGRNNWNSKALSYSGQIAIYRNVLIATGRPFASAWIHFAVGGGLVQIIGAK